MRRRLNIKLLAALFVGTLVFGGGVHVLHGIQVKRNADGLIARAEKAKQEGDLTESVRLMGRYLSHFPENKEIAKKAALDAKQNLFDMALNGKRPKRKEYMATIGMIENAVRVKAFDGDLKREAADFWFQMGFYKDASNMLDQLKRLAKNPAPAEENETPAEFTIEDELRQILCLIRIGGPEQEREAITLLSNMVGLDPVSNQFDESKAKDKTQVDAYFSLANLLRRNRGDTQLALATLHQMVKVNPENARAYLNRSRLIRLLVSGEEGKRQWSDDINEAYQRDRSDIEIIGAMARMFMERKDYETAKKLILEGMDNVDNLRQESTLYNYLVEVYSAQQDKPGAIAKLDEGLKKNPSDPELLWKKARFVLDEATTLRQQELIATQKKDDVGQADFKAKAKKKFAEVEGMFRTMELAKVDDPRIQYLKARISMQRDGKLLESTKKLSAVRELVTDRNLHYDIDIYLSMGYRALGQLDKRLEVINRILQTQPGSVSGQESYIETLMLMGRNQEALRYAQNLKRNVLKSGGKISANIEAMLVDLELRVRIDDSSEALTKADSAELFEKVKLAYNNDALSKEQKQALALRFFSKIKDTEKTIQIIDRMLAEDPKSFSYWGLRLQYARDKADAFEIFNRMKSNIDMNTYSYYVMPMEAKLFVKYAPEEAPTAIDRIVSSAASLPDAQKAALFYEMGILKKDFLKDRPDGVALLQQAHELQPKRLDILQVLFQDATRQKDGKRVDEIVDKIASVTGKNDDSFALVEAGRIIYHVENGDVPKAEISGKIGRARQLIERARQHRPQHVPLLRMMARIQIVEGDHQSAITTLQQAHGIQPNDPIIIRSIAQEYRNLGDESMVRKWMDRLPQSARGSGDIRTKLKALAATSRAWTSADQQEAVRLSNELTSGANAAITDWLLKSRVLMLAKQAGPAEEAAKKAIELDRSNPDTWTNYLSILVVHKKVAEAEAIIGQVKSSVPAEAQPLVLGRCYSILKKYSEAEASFLAAINKDPASALLKRMYAETLMAQNKITESAAVIEQIINTATPATQREVQWARRALAGIYAKTGSYDYFNKALALVDDNADEDGNLSPVDLQMWAALCFDRPESESWDRGLIRLEQIRKKRQLNDSEMFMKAQLYEKYDDESLWQQAKDLAVSVITKNPKNQRIVETYVKWLLKRGEVQSAQKISARLLPNNSVTQLRVKLHVAAKSGQFDKALAGIDQATPKSITSGNDASEVLTMAIVAEEMGQYSPKFYGKAVELLSRLVKKAPREVLRLATAMGLHGNTQSIRQALQLCREANKAGVEDAARAGVALLILRKHQDKWNGELKQDLNQVNQWLQQMAAAKPNDLKLRWRVAEYNDLIGKLDEVESQYRAILDSPEFTDPIERGMLINNLVYAMGLNGKSNAESMQLMKEARNLLGPTSDVVDTEGFIQFLQGNTELAIVSFERAIEVGPVTSQKYLHLALAYVKKAQQTKAKADKDKALQAWKNALKAGLNKSKLPPALHDEFDQLSRALGSQA